MGAYGSLLKLRVDERRATHDTTHDVLTCMCEHIGRLLKSRRTTDARRTNLQVSPSAPGGARLRGGAAAASKPKPRSCALARGRVAPPARWISWTGGVICMGWHAQTVRSDRFDKSRFRRPLAGWAAHRRHPWRGERRPSQRRAVAPSSLNTRLRGSYRRVRGVCERSVGGGSCPANEY